MPVKKKQGVVDTGGAMYGNGGLPDPDPAHHHFFGQPDERGIRKCTDPFCLSRIRPGTEAMDLWWQVEQLRFTVGALLTLISSHEDEVIAKLTGEEAFQRGKVIGGAMAVIGVQLPAATREARSGGESQGGESPAR